MRRPAARPEPPGPRSARVLGALLVTGIIAAAGTVWMGPSRSNVSLVTADPLTVDRAPEAAAGVPAGPPPAADSRAFLDPAAAGTIAYDSGDYERALAEFQAAVERSPDDAESHSNLGQMLVRLKRTEEALPHFDRAIGIVPQRWAYHFNRARALALLERWDEAIAGYRQAQQLFPDDYATAFNLAQTLHRKGDEAAAVEQYLRAIDLNPSDASFRLALGISYERLGKRTEASEAYAEYLRLHPDASDADQVRARITLLTSAS